MLLAGYGLYYGLTEGVEKAFVADVAPPELRSTAFGVYYFTLGIIAFRRLCSAVGSGVLFLRM